MNRVAITGVGAIGGTGPDAVTLLTRILANHSGVEIPGGAGCAAARAGDVAPRRATRRLDRVARLFHEACEAAWLDAGLDVAAPEPERVALIEGSSLGAMSDLLMAHRDLVTAPRRQRVPGALLRYLPGAGGSTFAQQRGLAGSVLHVSAGSVSATCAIGEAAAKIGSDEADVVLAGGSESPLHEEVLEAFKAAGVLAADGHCRPFDRRRSGTVLGEGAGVMVLESEVHARRRGARVHAWLVGYAAVTESHSMLAPDPSGRGVAAVTDRAMRGTPARELAFIKAHGTGTPLNDAAECRGLAAVFGPGLVDTPLVALKPALGHTLGASGALEGVAAVLALARRVVPPTLNVEAADPALPKCRVATEPENSRASAALLLSESFGGRCAALVVRAA